MTESKTLADYGLTIATYAEPPYAPHHDGLHVAHVSLKETGEILWSAAGHTAEEAISAALVRLESEIDQANALAARAERLANPVSFEEVEW